MRLELAPRGTVGMQAFRIHGSVLFLSQLPRCLMGQGFSRGTWRTQLKRTVWVTVACRGACKVTEIVMPSDVPSAVPRDTSSADCTAVRRVAAGTLTVVPSDLVADVAMVIVSARPLAAWSWRRRALPRD
eukprot:6406599-Prymnesium_polylepis.1